MRILPAAHVSLLLFILILVLSLGNAPVYGDADTAWHLAAGYLIRSTGHIPLDDPWSFTTTWDHWYNLSWLFDVGASLLVDAGGFAALYVLTILAFAGCITFMAQWCIRRGAGPVSVFLLTPLIILLVYGAVIARPTMCSLVLTLVFYCTLHRYRQNLQWRTLVILPPLMALWVNLHGGFLIAFLIMGLFLAEAIWQRNRQHRQVYAVAIAACLIATLVNPYGFTLYYSAWRTIATGYASYVTEFQPVEIGHNLPMTLLVLLVLVIGNMFDKRIPLVDRAISVVMLLLSLTGLRYSVFAALLLMPTLSLRLTSLFYESPIGARIKALDTTILHDMHKTDIRVMAALFASAAIVFLCSPTPRDQLLESPVGFPAQNFPVEEAAFVEQNYPGLHFINDYNIGGYLDYLWRGKIKVFVDGRCSSLYNEETLRDYLSFMEDAGFGGRAQVVVSLYHLDGVIVANNAKNAPLWRWNTDWKSVYYGKVATVYVRSDMPTPPTHHAPH